MICEILDAGAAGSGSTVMSTCARCPGPIAGPLYLARTLGEVGEPYPIAGVYKARALTTSIVKAG